MPYKPDHKIKTRKRIVECARMLFNRHGYDAVTIDMVMEAANLTRGGFYSHFRNKEEMFAAAVSSFLMGRGALWRSEAGIDPMQPNRLDADNMLKSYLSREHLGDVEGQCPMIALPSDVARGSAKVRDSYQALLEAMVGLFERSMAEAGPAKRRAALTLAALSVGGMVLARTMPASRLAEEVRSTAYEQAMRILTDTRRPPVARRRASMRALR